MLVVVVVDGDALVVEYSVRFVVTAVVVVNVDVFVVNLLFSLRVNVYIPNTKPNITQRITRTKKMLRQFE